MKMLRMLGAVACLMLAACASAPTDKAAAAPPAAQVPNLSGAWVLTTTSQMGAQDSEMTVRQDGEAISGTLASSMGTVDYKGTVQGTDVKFNFTIDAQGTSLTLDYSGAVQGDTMSGVAQFGDFGSGTWTAKRKQ